MRTLRYYVNYSNTPYAVKCGDDCYLLSTTEGTVLLRNWKKSVLYSGEGSDDSFALYRDRLQYVLQEVTDVKEYEELRQVNDFVFNVSYFVFEVTSFELLTFYPRTGEVERVTYEVAKKRGMRCYSTSSMFTLDGRDGITTGLGYTFFTCNNWGVFFRDGEMQRVTFTPLTPFYGYLGKYVIPTKRYVYVYYVTAYSTTLSSIDVETLDTVVYTDNRVKTLERKNVVELPSIPFIVHHVEGNSVYVYTEEGTYRIEHDNYRPANVDYKELLEGCGAKASIQAYADVPYISATSDYVFVHGMGERIVGCYKGRKVEVSLEGETRGSTGIPVSSVAILFARESGKLDPHYKVALVEF